MEDRNSLDTHSAEWWERYVKGRPKLPESFFTSIFNYHSAKGGTFDTAHDAGCGSGLHAPRLAPRFQKVVLSDISEENIGVAKSTLQGPQYSFSVSRFDSQNAEIADGTVDLIYASNVLHLVGNLDDSIAEAARQLKPGGTLCAALFGVIAFRDEGVNDVYTRFHNEGIRNVMKKLPWATARSAFFRVASALDSVPLPEAYFKPGVQRVKLNLTKDSSSFYDLQIPPELRAESPVNSEIGPYDKVVFREDNDWAFKFDKRRASEYLASFPWDMEDAKLKRLWAEVEDAIGSGEVDAYWPVSMILATRK